MVNKTMPQGGYLFSARSRITYGNYQETNEKCTFHPYPNVITAKH